MSTPGTEPLLQVEHLKVDFRTEDGVVHAVDDVSFSLRPGEVLAVVGESGSGKSVTAQTLMGLTRSPNARFEGSARWPRTTWATRPGSSPTAATRRSPAAASPGGGTT